MFTMKRGKWLYLILLSFFILMDGYLLIYNTRYRLILSKAVNTNNVSFNSDVNVSHTILTMNDIYENVGLQFRGGLLRDILNHEKISTDFILDSISNGDKIFACVFNQYDCEKCVTYALEKSVVFAKRNNLTLLVLGRFDEDIKLKAIRNNYVQDCNSQWYNIIDWSVPVEQHGNPFYMVLTKEGIIVDVFTPDKMDPKMTDRYFNLIETKWKGNKAKWF